MLNKLFKNKTSTSDLVNKLNKAINISNELFKLSEQKQIRIKLLEKEIEELKNQLNYEKEYNKLLKNGYESQRKNNSRLQGKLDDIRLTNAYQTKYN